MTRRVAASTLTSRQKMALSVLVTFILTAASTPAVAEGSWSSSVSGGLAGGFSSRWWDDRQLDSNPTRASFASCRIRELGQNATRIQTTLYRDNGIFPDHNHGTINNPCNGSSASWGNGLPAGSFRWELGPVSFTSGGGTVSTTGYHVDIPSLSTWY